MAVLVAYHGTTWGNARLIRSQGFLEGSYFAYRYKIAAQFGNVVFACRFYPSGFKGHAEPGMTDWQFWLRDPLPREHIIREVHHSPQVFIPHWRERAACNF
jgi:hypothetical protein